MKNYPLKEVSILVRVPIFILVEFYKDYGLDIKLEDAFEVDKIPQELYQQALNNRIMLKQLQFLRIEEINHKLSFLRSKKDSLGDMTGSQEDFEIARQFIATELKKTEAFVRLVKKQFEQVQQYIDSKYVIQNPDLNNKYYLYNSTGFVMQVDTLAEARDQARQFNCIIKDIRDNIVR